MTAGDAAIAAVTAAPITTVTTDDVEGAVLAYREAHDWEPVLDDLGAAEYLGVKARQGEAVSLRLPEPPYRPNEFAVMRKDGRYLEITLGGKPSAAPGSAAPVRAPLDPPSLDRTVEVAGCAVRLRHWPAAGGRNGRCGEGNGRMLLVHGTRANVHWWDHVARLLDPRLDCIPPHATRLARPARPGARAAPRAGQ